MSSYTQIKVELQSTIQSHKTFDKFCKTGPGDYAEHDKFLGIRTSDIRKLALKYKNIPLQEVQLLIDSPFNEERLLALLILVRRYEKGTIQDKDLVYQYYLRNLKQVNNWNLVDSSAHMIIGAYSIRQNNTDILFTLARSSIMWERRIAMVATWWFIRKGNTAVPLTIAEILLYDAHDLIHKAIGWMLREVGKHNQTHLIAFLDQHAHHMPRISLRYALEKFSPAQKQYYLSLK